MMTNDIYNTVFYKVRSRLTGEFCIGSKNGWLSFTKNGKSYNKIGHIKSMLKQFNFETMKYTSNHKLSDLEVIEYKTIEVYREDCSNLILTNKEGN